MILIFILIYKFSTTFLLKVENGKIFSYIINPISWLLLGIVIYLLTANKIPRRYKYENEMRDWLFISSLLFIMIYFSIGFFSGFGINPYNHSLEGILLNIWSLGTIILVEEYIRYVVINNNRKSDRLWVTIFLIATLVIIEINLLNFIGYFKNEITILKFLAIILIPKVIENILLIFTATKGGLVPNIIYKMIINMPLWMVPILPKSNWLVLSLLYCVLPFLTYIIINYFIMRRENSVPARLIKGISPRSIIFNFVIILSVVIFVLGGTSYIPTAIVTNSMYPNIKVGDVVITKKMSIDKIKIGDIIHIQRKDYYVIHRVVEKNIYQGKVQIVTKGDNNKSQDYESVTEDQVIGKIVLIVPKIGYPSYWINKVIRTLKDDSSV